MARARSIKPAIFANDDLADLAPLARLLFIGLWTIADRDGRLEDRPRRIKAQVLPFDDFNVDQALNDLQRLGFIDRYAVRETKLIQVVNFAKHQSPHRNEVESVLPDRSQATDFTEIERSTEELHPLDEVSHPTDEALALTADCFNLTADCGLLTADCGNPESRKGEDKPRRRSPSFAPPDWIPADRWRAYVQSRRSMRKHPMSAGALDACVAAISKTVNDGWSVDDVLDAMTENGWRSVRPDWMGNRQRESTPKESESDRAARIFSEGSDDDVFADNVPRLVGVSR